MPLLLATTPSEALRACHPEIPVPAGDERYVDVSILRGASEPLSDRFTFLINSENGEQFVKGLITGHRGNGKSSELFRLKKSLEDSNFYVVYFDIENEIGLSDVKGVEIVTLLAERLARAVEADGLKVSATALTDFYTYFDQRTQTEVTKTAADLGVEATAQAGATVPFIAKLLAKLTSTIKFSSERKLEVRREISLSFSEFTQRLNRLISEITGSIKRDLGKEGLVIIVDGLEKLAYEIDASGVSNYEEIFVRNADQLLAPACHVVYTVPMSLAYDQGLWAVWIDSVYVMPMLNMKKPQAAPLLREVLARRLDMDALFGDQSDVARIIQISGGCMRDLMLLVRRSCSAGTQIKSVNVNASIIEFQQGYDRLINEPDLPILEGVLSSGTIDQTGPGRQLLDKRVVLEYLNERRWIGIHPGVSESASFKDRMERYRRKVADEALQKTQS